MPEQHYRPETYRARDSVGYLVRRLYTICWLASKDVASAATSR